MDDVFDYLDRAASANLSSRGVQNYARWKAELLATKVPVDKMKEILSGFIWDESESESREENPISD